MKEQLTERLQQLEAEFSAGQNKLNDLEAQAVSVRNTMLRISGAIQVLKEELAKIDQTGSATDKGDDDAVVAMPSSIGVQG